MRYLATVVDQYPWQEDGWWSADIDVQTGISKRPLTKPSPINKNAAMVMVAGLLSDPVRELDADLAARLQHKAEHCLYDRLLPAQEPDGFWHYGLTGRDPKNKDVPGYFMLTATLLEELRLDMSAFRDPRLEAVLDRATTFASRQIAPMTDPNPGPPCAVWRTEATPAHHDADDVTRCLSVGALLFAGGYAAEVVRIVGCALKAFPTGNQGEDGAHAALLATLPLRLLRRDAAVAPA